jgi:hypothetical protein
VNLPLINTLRAQIARLEARMIAMETVIFQLSPSRDTKYLDNIEAVKLFLRKVDLEAMPPHVVEFLLERLPSDWRLLAKQHGHVLTFRYLMADMSIIEARRKLA